MGQITKYCLRLTHLCLNNAELQPVLEAGQVGFIIAGIKEIDSARVGDTITLKDNPADEALPGPEAESIADPYEFGGTRWIDWNVCCRNAPISS